MRPTHQLGNDAQHFTRRAHWGPMQVTLSDHDRPTGDELVRLYESVGWSSYTADPDTLQRAIDGSLHVVTARAGTDLVGLARVVGDGATIAYLQDVLVDPAHHCTGLGRRLVDAVFAPYQDVRQHVLLTDDEPGQRAFYEALGFSEIRDFGPGTLRAFVRFA